MASQFSKKKIRGTKQKITMEEHVEEADDSGQEEVDTISSSEVKKKRKVVDNRLGNLHEEISATPLGELLSLKDHMPAKLYMKAVFGKRKDDFFVADDAVEEATSDNEAPDETETGMTRSQRFKRDNRKRPREMSARKPVSVLRDVFVTKKRTVRDPRFDNTSGEFDSHVFSREYGFLDDLKKDEYQELRKEIKRETDPERLEKLRLLKQRMENQWRSEEDEERKSKLKQEVRRTNMGRMKEGKDPFYVKKSEFKRRLYDDRLERLEKEGKLRKYQERREKKLARKDKMML